jgi:hypothetical protein
MVPKKSGPTLSQEELDNRQRQSARILFLEQLDIKCPGVRNDLLKIWKRLKPQIQAAVSTLQDQLDEAFDASPEKVLAAEEGTLHGLGPTAHVWSWYRTAPQGPDTLRSKLESDIRAWARSNKIEADWIIDTAIENIARWCGPPAHEDRQGWFPPSVGMLGILTKEELKFEFSHQFWSGPSGRTRKDMENEVWKASYEAFDAWFQDLKEKMNQHGYQKNLRWDHPERDIAWFARFQCKREGFAKIAQGQKEVTADVVRHAVDKAAKRLGIERR